MKITIQDVAKKANVSVATVSRVMNGNYPVKVETRETVLKVIKELNYIPNMQARELTKQKSTTIGVVVPSITNMFFTELVNGIENELKSNSLSIILTCTHGDESEEQKCINSLIARNVSGIIVAGPSTDNIKAKFYDTISHKIPLVFINSDYIDSNISYVSNDEASGAKTALKYLLDNNHKEIDLLFFLNLSYIHNFDKKLVYLETNFLTFLLNYMKLDNRKNYLNRL